MLAQKIVRKCVVVFGTAFFFCATANAQSYGSFAPSGIYASLPGQPGAPPEYLVQGLPSLAPGSATRTSVGTGVGIGVEAEPPTVVVQAPDNVVTNQEPLPEQAPPPPPPQPIVYHSPQTSLAGPPPSPYMTLETRAGVDFGVQISDYHYTEKTPGLRISGIDYGGLLGVTGVIGDHFFGTLEGRYAAGWFDYTGTGSIHDRPNQIWEARGLFGKDFIYEYFSLTPFTGIGFEHTGSDLEGNSSTGAHLYDRDSDLLYVPVGLRPHFRLDVDSRITSSFEYDIPLQTEVTSQLGGAGSGDPSVRDEERSGYGLRGEIMYETRYWSFGPFAQYWNFDTSNPSVYHSPASTCGASTCSLTLPGNHTIEAGMQLKFHFF